MLYLPKSSCQDVLAPIVVCIGNVDNNPYSWMNYRKTLVIKANYPTNVTTKLPLFYISTKNSCQQKRPKCVFFICDEIRNTTSLRTLDDFNITALQLFIARLEFSLFAVPDKCLESELYIFRYYTLKMENPYT